MIPLFKSEHSIGKSILTIPHIFSIAQNEVVLVEDSMSGFRKANKESAKTGKPLRFGLRIETTTGNNPSKVIFFAKGNQGIDSLRRIYTKAFTKNEGIYELKKEELSDTLVAIPFYDSYIHRNIHNFGSHELDLEGLNPVYFEERNNHPFDILIKRAMVDMGIKTTPAKSIYYEKKEDFTAFQWVKSMANRRGGKTPTFERPELNYFCSDEFCWESYLEDK